MTVKFIGGLQTQRSPFASIDNRYSSRFLGGKPDALIAGSNVEISNSLTLQRRPGLTVFGPAIPAPLAFYDWKQTTPPNIQVIVDTATAVYNYSATAAGLLFFKSPNAGQTNFMSQANTLYAGDGVDLLKVTGPNLLTQSNTFTVAASWVLSTATLLANQFDPNGMLTATKVTWGNSFSTSWIQQTVTPNLTPVASNTFTASIWMRAPSGSPTTGLALLDQTGALITLNEAALTQTWTRYQVTRTMNANSTQVILRVKNDSGTTTFIQVYGAQLEVGGPATPTQLTTTQPQGVSLWGIVAPTAAPTVISTAVGVRWSTPLTPAVGQVVTDSNGNKEICTVSGAVGGTEPVWPLTKGSLTVDGGATWQQAGPNGLTPKTGYQWYYAFLNPVTGHPSNVSPVSKSTTSLANNLGVAYTLSGQGSPDPQVGQIAIYRNVDGGAFWFQVATLANPPGGGTWTFVDSVQDVNLNTQIYAPIGLLNSPPPAGAVNPVWHQSRAWVSVGSNLFFSSGPDNASLLNILQNGVVAESFAPANFIPLDETIVRSIPTSAGLLVMTTGDFWLITGSDLASFNPVKILAGHGIRSYNAADVDGSSLWVYTADRQLLMINASAGSVEAGFPIGDALNFDPAKVYVARHVAGSLDNGCFVADGSTGWYRVNPNQIGASISGEPTSVWSPFATITGGAQAVASLETTPGVHQLLVGATGTGAVLSLGNIAGTGANDASAGTAWTNPNNLTLDTPATPATVQLNIQGAVSGADVSGTATGVGTAVSTGAVTTGFNNELCFTVLEGNAGGSGTSTVTPGGGWTLDNQNSSNILIDFGPPAQRESIVFGTMHQLLAAAGPITGTATLSRTESWSATIAAFKAGSGAAPTIVQQGSNYTVSVAGVATLQKLLPSGTTLGNYLVVLVACDSTGLASSLTVSDSSGNTFAAVKVGVTTAIFLAPVTTAGVDTVTLAGGVGNMLGMTVYEITAPAAAGTLNSKQLQATNFNLNVPNNNILGVKVYVTGSQDSANADATFTLSWISPVGASPSYVFQLPAGGGTVSFGGVGSTWGQTLTAAVLNAAGFGFQLQANIAVTPNVNFNISAVKVQVFYLAAAPATAAVLKRDLTIFTDNGTTYAWNATFGSFLLASPGQLAEVESITTEVRAASGAQPAVAVLLDEIAGAFESLPNTVNDPPQLTTSATVLATRAYLSQGAVPPICRHIQVRLAGAAVSTKDELLSLTVRGALVPEQEV